MPLNLNELIFKKGSDGKNQLTTGAKIGGAVLAGGAAILMAKLKANKEKKKASSTEVAITEKTSLIDVPRETTPEKPKSNTMLYVGLGVGAVLIVGAVLLMTKKKA